MASVVPNMLVEADRAVNIFYVGFCGVPCPTTTITDNNLSVFSFPLPFGWAPGWLTGVSPSIRRCRANDHIKYSLLYGNARDAFDPQF